VPSVVEKAGTDVPQIVWAVELMGTGAPHADVWTAERLPVGGDRQVAIPGMPGELLQDGRGFTHGDLSWTRRGRIAEKSCLGEGAHTPWKARRGVEPLFDEPMMNMASGSQRGKNVDVEQMARTLRQAHPLRLLLPSPA